MNPIDVVELRHRRYQRMMDDIIARERAIWRRDMVAVSFMWFTVGCICGGTLAFLFGAFK